jgi:hypothetical protein
MKDKFEAPIPEKCLISRLKPVFAAINNGQSAAFLGVPGSGRVSFIRYLLATPNLKNRLIKKNLKVTFVAHEELIGNQVTAFIKSILNQMEGENQSRETLLTDPFILLKKLKERAENLVSKSRILIIIDNLEKLSVSDPMIANVVEALWSIKRSTPVEKISFLFIGCPAILEKESFPLGVLCQRICGHNIFYNPILTAKETDYSLKRYCYFLNIKPAKEKLDLLIKLFGGISSCHRLGVQIANENQAKETLPQILDNSQIRDWIMLFWEGLTQKSRNELKLAINGPLGADYPQILTYINPWVEEKKTEVFNGLTAQEENVVRFLVKNPDRVVAREEIAEAVWGKDYEECFSDWAISQILSRVRKKTKNKNFKILTARGRGYKLVS